tara:strand:+ start:213 stop:734 length:522 start_codon:yes stop_codon:yes gene_type:complete
METIETKYRRRPYEWKVLGWKNLSPYDILLLDTKCSDEDIRTSYRFLSMKYHPDKNKTSNASEIFQKISTAYETISTPEKRSQHAAGEVGKALRELKEEYPVAATIVGIVLLTIAVPIICVQKCYSFVQWSYSSIIKSTISGYNYIPGYETDIAIDTLQNDHVEIENNIDDID